MIPIYFLYFLSFRTWRRWRKATGASCRVPNSSCGRRWPRCRRRSSWTRSVAWNAELCRQSIGFSTLLTRFPRCAFSVLIWRHLLHLVSTATAGDGYSPEVTAVHAVLTSVLGLDWISFVSANSIQFSHIYTSLRLTVYLLDLYFFNLYTSYFLIANSVKLYCKCCYLSFQKIKF